MKRVTIESDNRDIQLECPNCDMWEQLGVDDPRKMLNALPPKVFFNGTYATRCL